MFPQSISLTVLDLIAGFAGGVIGIGGGIILVPALVLLFGLSQHQSQGTISALMVPPIGLLAAWSYWKQGYVDLQRHLTTQGRLPFVITADPGVAEIVRKQEVGWAYLKAGS